jgi:hypothetical protein
LRDDRYSNWFWREGPVDPGPAISARRIGRKNPGVERDDRDAHRRALKGSDPRGNLRFVEPLQFPRNLDGFLPG